MSTLKNLLNWLFYLFRGIIITIGIAIKLVEYNSLSSKNTRSLEKILFEDIKLGKYSNEGMVERFNYY